MLQIDSLHHDSTRGFRMLFRVDTCEDVIALGYIVKGLVASIPFLAQKQMTPDVVFCETVSTVIIDDALKGVTRTAEYDDEGAIPLYFGVLDPKDMDALNRVHNAAHGFSHEGGVPKPTDERGGQNER